MPEQVLDVEFPGMVLDGLGREGVAEAVGLAWTPARWPSRVKRVPRRYGFIGRRCLRLWRHKIPPDPAY